MRNGDKIRDALQRAFPDSLITVIEDLPRAEARLFVNGQMVARFDLFFWVEDDNPEIEITIKAPLNNIKGFVKDGRSSDIIRGAVERGFTKWENESHPNN